MSQPAVGAPFAAAGYQRPSRWRLCDCQLLMVYDEWPSRPREEDTVFHTSKPRGADCVTLRCVRTCMGQTAPWHWLRRVFATSCFKTLCYWSKDHHLNCGVRRNGSPGACFFACLDALCFYMFRPDIRFRTDKQIFFLRSCRYIVSAEFIIYFFKYNQTIIRR